MKVYVQGEEELIPLQGDDVTADSIENALGYTPADAETVEDISKTDDTAFYIVDKDQNIIAKIDAEGVKVAVMTVNGKDVESGLVTDEDRESWGGSDLDDVISKDDDGTLYVVDGAGNTITRTDSDGFHAAVMTVNGKDVESGLIPDDVMSVIDDSALYITDKDGNIITKTDSSGFHASDVFVINDEGTEQSVGETLAEFRTLIYAGEKQPTVTAPSYSFNASGGSGEIGSTFSLPTATFKVTSVGAYSYNDTGIKFSASITGGTNTKSGSDMVKDDKISITMSSGDTTYIDGSIKFTFTGSYSYNKGNTPKTSLGVDSKEVNAIPAKSESLPPCDCYFYGYRKAFATVLSSLDGVNTTDLATIRGWADKLLSSDINTISSLSANSGDKYIIVAKPSVASPESHKPTVAYYSAVTQGYDSYPDSAIQYVGTTSGGASQSYKTDYDVYMFTHSGTFMSTTDLRITV